MLEPPHLIFVKLMKQLKMHRDKESSQIMRGGDRDSKKGKRLEEEKKSRSARKMSMRREMKQNEHR